MITKITTIQEMTLQANDIGLYDFLFFKMDKSRDEIFNLIELWAEEFEKTHKNYDWDGDYYDEIDDFLGYRFESLKALKGEISTKTENTCIDRDGNPYIENESFPAGGGLDKRCSYNGDALHSFYTLKDRDKIYNYLTKRGWDEPIHSDEQMEIWECGDTKIYFESYTDGMWGYVYTEFVG